MFLKHIFILMMITIISGCTTLADSVAAKGTGVSKTYNHSKEHVWPIVISAVESSKLDLVSATEDAGLILAQRGMSAFSYGENVAIFVDTESENTCKVEVVSKRSLETNVFAPDWSATILNSVTFQLKEKEKEN